MNLDWQDKRWHVRLYLWAEPVVARFFDSYSRIDWQEQVHTNLCPYMRTLLLWLPLALFTNLLAAVAVIATVTYIPGRLFGWRGYLLVLAELAMLIAFGWLCGKAYRALGRWKRQRRYDAPPPVTDSTPGFRTVLREYSQRVHDGICPGITITRAKGTR